MPETLDRELKILVERVVRPLPLPVSRQRRLRTEFLEHLQTIYAEELARDGHSAAALVRTQERFGDPEKLTAELRSTIRFRDLANSWFERLWVRETRESTLKHLARVVGWTTLFVSVFPFGLPVYPFVWLANPELGWLVPFVMTVVIMTAGFTASLWGVLLFCSVKLGEELFRPDLRWKRVVMLAFPIVATGPLSMAAGVFFSGQSTRVVHLQEIVIHVITSCVIAALLFGLATFLGVRQYHETSYRREWANLDLDAA